MSATGQAICLNMIVKNEAPVIRRCIDSVRAIIDHWVIVDTGSTDGTQDIIREYLCDVPGELHERPWRDFAHNRSEALELARGKGDYTLVIDADDTLEPSNDAVLPELTADSYMIEISDTAVVYQRTQLVRNTLPWRYEGVLHEFLTCDGARPSALLAGVQMQRNHDGARRKDPQTYRRDAALLEAALKTETNPFLRARYRFYLAQSYRDCGERQLALEHYLARAELGFWQEEVFISLYCAAQLKEQLGHPDQGVIDAYLRAADALPTRVEALHGASRFCRQKKRHKEGYQIAKRGLEIPVPPGALFVEPWIYDVGLLDELSINAYWCGNNRESLDASLKILMSGKLPETDTRRVLANARFASEGLPQDSDLGSLGIAGFVEQHPLGLPRLLQSRLVGSPLVFMAILAQQQEELLPQYLECLDSLDYPKSSIFLYIRTYKSADATERLLHKWVDRVGHSYAGVEFDSDDAERSYSDVHERNAMGSGSLGYMRNVSLSRALERECDFYFVADVDNFVRPCTLRELVALNLPIVAPFLRSVGIGNFYSNFHAEIDVDGYYKECDQYHWILNRWVCGLLEMPVVHSTYLIRADVLRGLAYEDGTQRHEYVVFSESARNRHTPQYLDNRQVYGYIASRGERAQIASDLDQVRSLLRDEEGADLTGLARSVMQL